MTPRDRRFPAVGRHLTLLRTFSVLSALVIMLIAGAVAWRVQGEIERMALQQEAVLAQGQAAALLHMGLFRPGTSAGLTPGTLRQLAAYTRQNMQYAHVGLVGELRQAIEQDELVLHYRPMRSRSTNRSCATCPPTPTTSRSRARSSTWGTTWA